MKSTVKFSLLLSFMIIFCYNQSLSQWDVQFPPVGGFLLSVDFQNPNRGIASGSYGAGIIYNMDGGNAWTSANIPDSTRAVVSVQMLNSLTGYATGAYDLFKGKDEQNRIKTVVKSIINSNHILKRREIKLGKSIVEESYRALFLKTTDGGVNWFTYGQVLDSILYFRNSTFLDENIGYAITSGSVGYFGKILKTTDGGLNWSQQNTSDPNLFLIDIDFINENKGIVTGLKSIPNNGYAGIIFRTIDGGNNWESTIYPEIFHFSDISFSTTDKVYALALSQNNESIIYKSIDGGVSWDSVLIISKITSQTVLEGIDFVRNSDVGITYGDVKERDTLGINHFKPIILSTSDGGENWSEPTKIDSPEESFLFASKMIDENIWYLCGGNPALILKTANGGVSFVEEEEINETPTAYHLSNNFPNPFNPSTTIQYKIPETGLVSLQVYNLLGEVVATLVNEEKSAGTYDVEFSAKGGSASGGDTSSLPSGIYFYKLQTGSFVETKKMILMK